MSDILVTIGNTANTQTCLWGFICGNDTFISIYGVIFTIVISLGVYIYGLQDKREKITLIHGTDIKTIIRDGLLFFFISFIKFPASFYGFLNFILLFSLLLKIWSAFKVLIKFNSTEFSAENAVKKFTKSVIQEKLEDFELMKIQNEVFQKRIDEEKYINSEGKEIKRVERFVFEEQNKLYNFLTAQKTGYITNLDLDFLFSLDNKEASNNSILPDKPYNDDLYYIPYNISIGAPIDIDTVILGIRKRKEDDTNKNGLSVEEKLLKLQSFVSISEEFDNPWAYFQAQIRAYYSDIFNLIKSENAKELELKLEECSDFINLTTKKPDSHIEVIQYINDNFIFPIQKQSFKQADVDCIRKVVSFSLGYIYESLDKKSIQTFNIFLRNLGNAFYESLNLPENKQLEFHEVYFRWLKEVAKYSIKPRALKDSDYLEFQINFLSNINGLLKLTFDRQDKDSFLKTLAFLDDSFSRESHEHEELPILTKMVENKKAVIFGVTAWIYKYYDNRKNEPFYKEVLSHLLSALKKDPQYSYHDRHQDDLNYYLSTYMKAVEFSEKRGSFGWDSWGMPMESVYTVTIRHDIQNLLADRIFNILIENPNLEIVINDENYDDMLANTKEGNPQFDPLNNKGKLNFISTQNLTDEQFTEIKIRFYAVFKKITEQYEAGVKKQLIEQQLDQTKFDEFVKDNFDAYKKARVLNRIQKFIKDAVKKKDGFGYNILLHKEQFVAVTNIHYVHGDQFGEELARSEDNKVLESIYNKFKTIPLIKKEKIGQLISKENNINAVILWINGHFNLQDTNPETFTPYWQEANSKQDNGQYYQGSINGVPVYIIYKFQEHKKYPDTVFIMEDSAFAVHEFEIEKDENDTAENTMFADDPENCLTLSITNLSPLEDQRTKIAEKWIENDPSVNKEESIEKMKTNVVLKFFKGLSTGDIKVDQSKMKTFRIN